MTRHWSVSKDSLEINQMPFYWRLSNSKDTVADITPRLPIRIVIDSDFDYLRCDVRDLEWQVIDAAYRKNENIGFLNEESGQLQTYGSSVNNFFLDSVRRFSPENIYEIGCGAGLSIQYLKKNGWDVIGIDPSEYSLYASRKLGFSLLNNFFNEDLLKAPADFIFCNDVFEHVRDAASFSKKVYESLANGGVFCFATTNSTESISIGDISMLEHQHVNMFTERSIYQILQNAGFSIIEVKNGSYGNTFHVTAKKNNSHNYIGENLSSKVSCLGFFERAKKVITAFESFYEKTDNLHCYVPLRCMPYLASVGDYGRSPVYDSNAAWRGKYIDGYSQPIFSSDDITNADDSTFFIGSLTFHKEIKSMLKGRGFSDQVIYCIFDFL